MTIAQQILADLLIGPSTADSMAGRFGMADDAMLAALRDSEIAGTVESAPLKCLTVFRLTPEGRALADTLPRSPKFPD